MMNTLNIVLDTNGTYHYTKDEVVENITIQVKENVNALVILTLNGDVYNTNIKIDVNENAHLSILYKGSNKEYVSNEEINIYQDASIDAGYFSLDAVNRKIKAVYHLLNEGSSAHVITTTLAKKDIDYDISCVHEKGHTLSNMENYSIAYQEGNYHMVAGGDIKKYARQSKSHQSTRVLTLGSKERVSVTPLLLIDENDVEASHACSIGEMNEDYLYYLQSRGLRKEQALGLLTLSYIYPILQLFDKDSDEYKEMEAEIENKVGLSC